MTPIEIAEQLCELIASETASLDPLARRIVIDRIYAGIAPWLPPVAAAAKPGALVPFTDDEARRFGQSECIKFGVHRDKRIDEVPLEYLVWITDASRSFWRDVWRYLESDRIKAEREGRGL